MTGFSYDGVRCSCGAVFVTAVERCPECGSWDPAPSPVSARGTLLATTSTETEPGVQRTFVLVELDGGLRIIGLARGEPAVGAAVIAIDEDDGVRVFAHRADSAAPADQADLADRVDLADQAGRAEPMAAAAGRGEAS